MEDVYAVIDMKSFYASCECAARGLDIFTTPLAVCDPSRSENTIVMSVTPYLKSHYGCSNVERMKDLPRVEGMIYATPRMSYYIHMSCEVVSIFMDYVDEEDLHVYSIDESFLHLSPYLSLYHCSALELVAQIQDAIKRKLGLVATAGLGPNMFLAKTCLDNDGKKKPPFRSYWHQEDVKEKLWKIPLMDVWGISTGITARLRKLGVNSMEALAKIDVSYLEKEFGVMGDQLHDLANGIDRTDIRKKYKPLEKHLSTGQTLMRNYSLEEAKLVLREMCDDLCFRLRYSGQKTSVVSLGVGYLDGKGFSRQAALNAPSDDNDELYAVVLRLLHDYAVEGPIRDLGIAFGKLGVYSMSQLSLFSTAEQEQKNHDLHLTLDSIALRYGRNAVLRATSLEKSSTTRQRHEEIGGHKA